MPITIEELRAILSAEEPNYKQAARLGAEALPHLAELARGRDMTFATKAVYLASLIPDPQAFRILEGAASSAEPLLRVAAASGVGNLPGETKTVLLPRLLRDADLGVRKTALQATANLEVQAVRQAVQAISQTDSNPHLRELAIELLDRPR